MSIFSHSIGCLFVLLMVSIAVQKLFSLIESHLFIFSFVSLAREDWQPLYFTKIADGLAVWPESSSPAVELFLRSLSSSTNQF